MSMEHVEKHYDRVTIRSVGKNEFGSVFAIYSHLLEMVIADICTGASGKYVLRVYCSCALTKDALKNICDFMDYAEQLESVEQPLDNKETA